MKKTIAAVAACGALVLGLALSGCSGGLTAADFKGQTVACAVTKVNGDSVTVNIGELTQSDAQPGGQGQGGQDGQQPPDMPNSSQGSQAQSSQGDQAQGQQPPDMPSGSQGSQAQSSTGSQQPPAKPDGDQSGQSQNGQQQGQEPPAKPDGDQSGQQQGQQGQGDQAQGQQGQQPPDMPSGGQGGGSALGGNAPGGSQQTFTAGDKTATFDLSGATISSEGGQQGQQSDNSISSLKEGTILKVKINDSGKVESATIVQTGGGFGGSGSVNQGTAANTIDTEGTYANKTYDSTGNDENALRVTGTTATLDSITVNKTAGSSSNTEDGDFYGMNAALLVTDKATATIKNATITSNTSNGNGIFSYGSGTTVNVEDTVINTTGNSSGGIQTTGGGTTNAKNLTITTQGGSSAPIRSDRGGGTVNVDGGTYTSSGIGSPAIYSTANITTKNATLTSNNSEAMVIEGKNSITLENCNVTGNMTSSNGGTADNLHTVMIYQSMSGDADVGTSSMNITGGSLTGKKGDMFYITNTHAIMNLTGVNIKNEDASGYLLNVCGNSSSRSWGKAGSNGGQLELATYKQELTGNIVVDTISTLKLALNDGSSLTGAINIVDNTAGGQAVADNAVVEIGSGCTWTLTGNCKITSLANNGTINFNGYSITLADGTVLQ